MILGISCDSSSAGRSSTQCGLIIETQGTSSPKEALKSLILFILGEEEYPRSLGEELF